MEHSVFAYLSYAKVSLGFRMIIYFNLLYCTEAFAHILKKCLTDVVIEISERHFFWKWRANVITVKLKKKNTKILVKSLKTNLKKI